MYRLALNMLFGDLAKLAMLLCGLAFSALLMAQQSSVFFGIMSWTYTPMVNIRAQVWVSDPMVEQVNDAKPLRDTDLGRVRSVDGVAWAAPLHTSFVQARMQDGNFKLITLVGIDADTFAGAPAVLSQGRIEDLRLPDTVIVDEWGAALMGRMGVGPDGKPRNTPLKVGDTFEINDISPHRRHLPGEASLHRRAVRLHDLRPRQGLHPRRPPHAELHAGRAAAGRAARRALRPHRA